MDPTTLILTALVAGAAASVKDTATQAVKDAYNGFKMLIHNKLVGKPVAEMALAQFEEDPDVWKVPLEKELKKTGVVQDKEIIDTAQRVMTLVQPQQAAQGKYNVQITGNVQGFVQGDHAKVDMKFGAEPGTK